MKKNMGHIGFKNTGFGKTWLWKGFGSFTMGFRSCGLKIIITTITYRIL
jgi:hypothetical protein